MSILENINSSNDIKHLDDNQLEPLCREIRAAIISGVSQTGGHLASSLGAVELTVALHRVYDTARDRIVFDVGHQCYAHKIITGRRDAFSTLRQTGGISGFPKPHESEDDAFIAGHASNSVSVALGMARARTLKSENYDVCAVIGDGALTGGLAYEGLLNAAASGEPLVIILNDNGMSINSNVGAMAGLLSKARVRPGYFELKSLYRRTIGRLPRLYELGHKVKEGIKDVILPSNIFDDLGLYYLGPVDGHDVAQLESVISWAKNERAPVLLHVITRKGHGCSYAENDPTKYHGVGPFDARTGLLPPAKADFSAVMGEELCTLARNDHDIVAITAAMANGTGLNDFAKEFPDRFFDVGIAEGSAVSMAAGMAKQGLKPVFAVYSSFLQRGYDMLVHDVALLGLHVVLLVDRAGLVGADGETHHGVFDVSYLTSIPGMTVLCPSDFDELRVMLKSAIYDIEGPVAVRYPRGGRAEMIELTESSDNAALTLAAYGEMAAPARIAAAEMQNAGIAVEFIKLDKISPLDDEALFVSLRKTKRLLIAEAVCAAGCVGERILAEAAARGIVIEKARLLNLGEGIVPHGSAAALREQFGIDAAAVARAAAETAGGV